MTDKSAITLVTMAVLMLGAVAAQAQTFTTLYNFTGGSDGGSAFAGVIQDPAGNLYGTTFYGGDLNCKAPSGCGVVYEVNTAGTETVLHSFSGDPDGEWPVTPVARDKAGNIYGTTWAGGSGGFSGCYGGCGTVLKIDTAGNATVLYNFPVESDGCYPLQGVIVDKSGNLYGTTSGCGSSNNGTIFKIDSTGEYTLLHSFAGYPTDGAEPQFGRLAMDKSGNLYGVTTYGGAYYAGVLYELKKNGTFRVLHSFCGISGCADGCLPLGSVAIDEGGLYGVTSGCGSDNKGTIWKVSKKGKATILHTFAGGTSDGCFPVGGVTWDSQGNLYGVTQSCGANNGGTFYELGKSGTLTLLHSFDGSDGVFPVGEVLLTPSGKLFGTTDEGGTYGYGTVWSYVP